MRDPRHLTILLLAAALTSVLHAQVFIETVPVGNPGNPGRLAGASVGIYGNITGAGNDRLCGSVDYPFEIGKYEITVAQYVAFLNAVAASDPYGLYSGGTGDTTGGNNIQRLGSAGNYTYRVGDGSPEAMTHWGNRPVSSIAWCDAARFCNWMQNGQPTGLLTGNGAADAWLTEDGTYATLGAPFQGANSNVPYQTIVRRPGATWVIPSEDEWFKAAYHKNDGVTGNYWEYPTQLAAPNGPFGAPTPNNDVIDPDPGQSANFHIGSPDDDCIGPPFTRTNVGEFENSASAYGTYDQAGNVWEWTDTRYIRADGSLSLRRVIRGGSYYPSVVEQQPDGFKTMHYAWRQDEAPVAGVGRYGFRLAKVHNDCNANNILDQDEIAAGTAHDYNVNGILDSCDIAAGTSEDCNDNGIPDEAEVGLVDPIPYFVDDGVPGGLLSSLGYPGEESEGYLVWMNHFTATIGRETIDAIRPAILPGHLPDGAPFTVYLWGDEGGAGHAGDAVVLASAAAVMSPTLAVVDIPNTYVGPAGTSFFVGVVIHIADTNNASPATYDDSTDQRQSWVGWSAAPIDPDALGTLPTLANLSTFLGGGNFMVRAIPSLGVEQLPDVNGNGVPDECELPPCVGDLNGDRAVNLSDLATLLAHFGTQSGATLADGDIDGDHDVDLSDLAVLLANFGTSCE